MNESTSVSQAPGLVIYAKDKDKVANFYKRVLNLENSRGGIGVRVAPSWKRGDCRRTHSRARCNRNRDCVTAQSAGRYSVQTLVLGSKFRANTCCSGWCWGPTQAS